MSRFMGLECSHGLVFLDKLIFHISQGSVGPVC